MCWDDTPTPKYGRLPYTPRAPNYSPSSVSHTAAFPSSPSAETSTPTRPSSRPSLSGVSPPHTATLLSSRRARAPGVRIQPYKRYLRSSTPESVSFGLDSVSSRGSNYPPPCRPTDKRSVTSSSRNNVCLIGSSMDAALGTEPGVSRSARTAEQRPKHACFAPCASDPHFSYLLCKG